MSLRPPGEKDPISSCSRYLLDYSTRTLSTAPAYSFIESLYSTRQVVSNKASTASYQNKRSDSGDSRNHTTPTEQQHDIDSRKSCQSRRTLLFIHRVVFRFRYRLLGSSKLFEGTSEPVTWNSSKHTRAGPARVIDASERPPPTSAAATSPRALELPMPETEELAHVS